MSQPKPAWGVLLPGLFSILAPVVAVGLAIALPVERVSGGTKCVGEGD
jgi:hypothetical protein